MSGLPAFDTVVADQVEFLTRHLMNN